MELQKWQSDRVVEFAQELEEDEQTEFSFDEALVLSKLLGFEVATPAIRALTGLGFKMRARAIPKPVRGFKTSSNDRWYGPGSDKTHGGSGEASIQGFVGRDPWHQSANKADGSDSRDRVSLQDKPVAYPHTR